MRIKGGKCCCQVTLNKGGVRMGENQGGYKMLLVGGGEIDYPNVGDLPTKRAPLSVGMPHGSYTAVSSIPALAAFVAIICNNV